jgi:hypothetical protein
MAALCIKLLGSEKCKLQRSKHQLPLVIIDLSPFNSHFVRDLWIAGSRFEPTASTVENPKQNGWCA